MNKEILKLAIPNILSNLTIPLVSLVDVGLMGHLDKANHIVSIGFGVMIFNFIYWSFGFLRMGTTGIISQAFGSGSDDKLVLVLKQSILIGLIGSIVLILFQDFLLELSIWLIDGPEETSGLIGDYFAIRIWAAPATILIYVFTGWFLGMQNSRTVLYLTLLINIANAGVSYFLVSNLEMKIEGVAYGTLIAQYLGLIYCLFYFYRKYPKLFQRFIQDGTSIKEGMKSLLLINANIFIRTFLLILVLSLFKVKAGSSINSELGAANILLLEFITLSAYGIDGFAYAAESLCGKYFGRKQIELFKKAVSTSFIWGLLCGLLFSIIFIMFGGIILNVLTDKVNIIEIAKEYLPWLIAAPLINSIAFIWDGVYIGATASKLMRNTMIVSTLVFLLSYQFLSQKWDNHGLWLALLLFMLCRGVLQTILYKPKVLKLMA